jgi:hypothetical protein
MKCCVCGEELKWKLSDKDFEIYECEDCEVTIKIIFNSKKEK